MNPNPNALRVRMNYLRTELVKTSKAAVAAGLAFIRNTDRINKLYARVKVIKNLLKKVVAMLHTRLYHTGKTNVKATRTVFEVRYPATATA